MKRKDAAMTDFHPKQASTTHAGKSHAGKRAGAALLAVLLAAGTTLPAAAAGDGEQAESETRDMSVEEAWANAKQDWRDLEKASGDAWGEARKEFEKSWRRLQDMMSESDGAAPPPDDPAELEGKDAQ
jgi:hypothetical protein